MKFRPLGIAKEIIQAAGMQVTYTYDDLVFIEHSPILVQFDDKNKKNLKVYFNVDCETAAAEKIEKKLNGAATEREFTITITGEFEMAQKKGVEEIEVRLLPF
ncbi:MAG: hypothetical protein PVG39_12275 [Desulfobacteraceae bacterium]|jgi:hypothetical protein